MTDYQPLYLDTELPTVFRAQGGVTKALKDAYGEADLPMSLVELINVRASQINGCSTCLSVHIPRALKSGVTQRQIDLLPSWRHSTGVFSDQEKAAIELAELVTELPVDTDYTERLQHIAQHFTPDQLVAAEWAALNINSFNRISILSQHPTRDY